MIKLYIDAASNGEAVGVGYVWYQDKQQHPVSQGVNIRLDNHQAEIFAVYLALSQLKTYGLTTETLVLYSDSKVVVQALQRRSAKGKWQHTYLAKILPLLDEYPLYFVEWFNEKENQLPDQLAKRALYTVKTNQKSDNANTTIK